MIEKTSAFTAPTRDLPTLLLVEDDTHLAELTQEYLEQQPFTVSIEKRGDSAVQCCYAKLKF